MVYRNIASIIAAAHGQAATRQAGSRGGAV